MKQGVRLSEVPLRIYDYSIVCGNTDSQKYPDRFELPRSVNMKNQGNVSACAACAFATILEHIFDIEMSEAFVYGYLRSDVDKSPGMNVLKLLELAVKATTVPLSDFGVLLEMPEMKKLVQNLPELISVAEKHKIGGFANLNYANKNKRDEAIKHALLTNKTDDGNDIPLLAISDDYFGERHAIVLRGWNDENDTYIIQNSWGKDWEDNGYGEIPKDEINAVFAIFSKGFVMPFTDVSEDEWFFKPVKNMYFSGLMNGVGDNKFEPDRPITRAEAAAMFDRHCKQDDENHQMIYKVLNELIELQKELKR